MSPTERLPARRISDAKDHLSEVMNEVVRQRKPQLIERNDWDEVMALIGIDELRHMLAPFSFEPRVSYGDEVVMTLDRLGLVSSGDSLEAAAVAMVSDLRRYATDFLARYDYLRHTSQSGNLPWVYRFLVTPAEAQRALLFEEPGSEAGVLRELSPAAR